MKLIDADKLKTNLWDLYCHYACNGSDLNKAAALNVGLGAIEVQEEVEAIPISWLLKKMQEEYDKSNLDTIAVVEIGRLIDEWRKENEID